MIIITIFRGGKMSLKEKTNVKEKEKIKLPKMYKVVFINDNYTTMEFVIEMLIKHFNKNELEAINIMYLVHKQGSGIAGIYPKEIASTKIKTVMEEAKMNKFPLKLIMEEVE